jgi:hypothetical protein
MIRRWISGKVTPVMRQGILIFKGRGTRANSNPTRVSNTPFMIPFEELFPRPPTPNSNENDRDIEMARLVWKIQLF